MAHVVNRKSLARRSNSAVGHRAGHTPRPVMAERVMVIAEGRRLENRRLRFWSTSDPVSNLLDGVSKKFEPGRHARGDRPSVETSGNKVLVGGVGVAPTSGRLALAEIGQGRVLSQRFGLRAAASDYRGFTTIRAGA